MLTWNAYLHWLRRWLMPRPLWMNRRARRQRSRARS